MDSDRFCPDTDTPHIVAHYEIPRETYFWLQELESCMDTEETTRPFAATLRSLFGRIVCVLED
jgi:hypothetical protein